MLSRSITPTRPGSLATPPGDRWFVDETYVKVNGVWRYVYRAIDQYGQVIDVPISARRDSAAARRFLRRALSTLKATPVEVVTDAAPIYPAVLEELVPAAWHHVEHHANNPIEADHSQLKPGSDRPGARRARRTATARTRPATRTIGTGVGSHRRWRTPGPVTPIGRLLALP